MKRTKRWLAGLLCAVLLAGLLPTAAFAAQAGWATPAVTALNNVYGNGIFSADDVRMTQSDLKTILGQIGATTKVTLGTDTNATLTRGTACAVLADIFDLPVTGSAIQYLYNQHIINGKDASGSLGQSDPITKAEFAVITYRVLNSVGGGLGSATVLKPGTKEYFSLLYLSYRVSALSGQDLATLNTAMDLVTNIPTQRYGETNGSAHQWGYTELGGEDLWNAWAIRLNYLKDNSNTDNATIDGAEYDKGDTLIDAAVKMVDAYIAAGGSDTIFSDVKPNSWYYDGVVYLADRGIVTGFGDGMFGPTVTDDPATVLTRGTLAVILFRADKQGLQPGDDWQEKPKQYAAAQGYMTPDNSVPNWWDAAPTREETIVAIMKQQRVNISTVNTAILDRFSDASNISADAKPYVAYAVSLGIVNGNASGALNPNSQADRGTAGVLLYRTLLGADKTKMKDYADDVSYVTGAAQAQTFALFAAPAAQAQTQTLTLREDWRLTSDLDLAVPEGATLTINGGGHHIYEMGGILKNTGAGTATFADGTILYPAANDAAGVTSSDGTWDTNESIALMNIRQGNSGTDPDPGPVTGSVDIEYTRFTTPAAHLASGYFTIKNVSGGNKIQSGHKYLVQLVHSGVASIFVVDAQSDNTLKFLCNSVTGDSLGVWDLTAANITDFADISNATVNALNSNCVVWQQSMDSEFFVNE